MRALSLIFLVAVGCITSEAAKLSQVYGQSVRSGEDVFDFIGGQAQQQTTRFSNQRPVTSENYASPIIDGVYFQPNGGNQLGSGSSPSTSSSTGTGEVKPLRTLPGNFGAAILNNQGGLFQSSTSSFGFGGANQGEQGGQFQPSPSSANEFEGAIQGGQGGQSESSSSSSNRFVTGQGGRFSGPTGSRDNGPIFEQLPPNFVLNAPFFPDISSIQEGTTFNGGIIDLALTNDALHPEEPGCIPGLTTTVISKNTVVPVTKHSAIFVTETTNIPQFHTRQATVYSFRGYTQTVTHEITSSTVNTVAVVVTSTKVIPGGTILSTSTTTVTNFVDRTVTSSHLDTVILKSTDYVTVTRREETTATRYIPSTVVSFVQLPANTKNVAFEETSTVNFEVPVPARTVYRSNTQHLTETQTAVIFLNAETIVSTSTTIVPSYTTIFDTVTDVRTKTLRTTVPVVKTKTHTDFTSTTRVAINTKTRFSTTTRTVTEYKDLITLVPTYVTVTQTRNIPVTITHVVTDLQGQTQKVTLDGPTVTSYSTHTYHVASIQTVTETLSTPIFYRTTTITESCRPTILI